MNEERRQFSIAGENPHVENAMPVLPEVADIFRRLDALNLSQRELAAVLGIDENKISKVRGGVRQFKAAELLKARAWLETMGRRRTHVRTVWLPPVADGARFGRDRTIKVR